MVLVYLISHFHYNFIIALQFDGNPVNNPGLRPNLQFNITAPNGNVIKHPANGWRWSKETMDKKFATGEQGDISQTVGWQGGGSFVYCELAKLNQTIVEEIEAATDDTTLSNIYGRMVKSGFISYKVNPVDIDAAADDYAALSLDDKKRFLMEILDKNLLYVNYCDIDDEEFGISDEDKAFTRSFYGEG